MASSSKVMRYKSESDKKVTLIKLGTYEEPKYKLHPEIASQIDQAGAFSSILPRVLLVQEIHTYIHCKVSEVGDFELQSTYQELS